MQVRVSEEFARLVDQKLSREGLGLQDVVPQLLEEWIAGSRRVLPPSIVLDHLAEAENFVEYMYGQGPKGPIYDAHRDFMARILNIRKPETR